MTNPEAAVSEPEIKTEYDIQSREYQHEKEQLLHDQQDQLQQILSPESQQEAQSPPPLEAQQQPTRNLTRLDVDKPEHKRGLSRLYNLEPDYQKKSTFPNYEPEYKVITALVFPSKTSLVLG